MFIFDEMDFFCSISNNFLYLLFIVIMCIVWIVFNLFNVNDRFSIGDNFIIIFFVLLISKGFKIVIFGL